MCSSIWWFMYHTVCCRYSSYTIRFSAPRRVHVRAYVRFFYARRSYVFYWLTLFQLSMTANNIGEHCCNSICSSSTCTLSQPCVINTIGDCDTNMECSSSGFCKFIDGATCSAPSDCSTSTRCCGASAAVCSLTQCAGVTRHAHTLYVFSICITPKQVIMMASSRL